MKDFFSENNERYSIEAFLADKELTELLRPFFDKWIALDYPIRQIMYLVQGAAWDIGLENLIVSRRENDNNQN